MLSVFDVFVVVVGSYALLKVLRTVGEAALSVSSRREAALPNTRGWWVLTVSLGRCEEGREGIIGSDVAMVDCSAGDDEKVGGAGCDIKVDIMGETCRTRARARWAQTEAVWRGTSAFLGRQVQRPYLLMYSKQVSGQAMAVLLFRLCVLRAVSSRSKTSRGPCCF